MALFSLIPVLLLSIPSIAAEETIRIRITKSGLDQLTRSIWTRLTVEANSNELSIPDLLGGEMEARNIRVSELAGRVSSILSPPSFLGLRIEQGRVRVTSDVTACTEILFTLCRSFSVNILARNVSFEITATLNSSGTVNRRVRLEPQECRVSIGELDLTIDGEPAESVMGFLSDRVIDDIKSEARSKICHEMRGFVERANAHLTKTSISLGSTALEVSSAVTNSIITDRHVEFGVRAVFSGSASDRSASLVTVASSTVQTEQPPRADDESPIAAWITEKIVNEFFHSAFEANMTRFVFSREIPSFAPYFLLLCKTYGACPKDIPDYLTRLGEVRLLVSASSPPRVSIRGQDRSASIHLNGTVDASGTTTRGRVGPIVRIDFSAAVIVRELRVTDGRLIGRTEIVRPTVEIVEPSQPSNWKSYAEAAMPIIVRKVLQLVIDDQLVRGVSIPAFYGLLKVEKAKLDFSDGVIRIGVDDIVFQ